MQINYTAGTVYYEAGDNVEIRKDDGSKMFGEVIDITYRYKLTHYLIKFESGNEGWVTDRDIVGLKEE